MARFTPMNADDLPEPLREMCNHYAKSFEYAQEQGVPHEQVIGIFLSVWIGGWARVPGGPMLGMAKLLDLVSDVISTLAQDSAAESATPDDVAHLLRRRGCSDEEIAQAIRELMAEKSRETNIFNVLRKSEDEDEDTED